MSTRDIRTRGAEALEHFISDERPVRWWHVAQTVTRDGEVLRNVQAQMWGGSNASPHFNAEVVRANPLSATRGDAPTNQQFRNVVIIVDANRAGAVRLEGLADYIAMVALAQLDPSADTNAYDTVLNLFSGPGAATTMTNWDRAYLGGLYTVDPNATSARRQAGRIATEMHDTLTN